MDWNPPHGDAPDKKEPWTRCGDCELSDHAGNWGRVWASPVALERKSCFVRQPWVARQLHPVLRTLTGLTSGNSDSQPWNLV
jgi:hypothetical protein